MLEDLFLGNDLHKDTIVLYGETAQGEILVRETLPTRCKNQIRDFFAELSTRYRVVAAVESVGFYQWFWDLVRPLVAELHLADASQVRAAAGRLAKTDMNDAATLARLLRQKSLPTAFVPDPELRELRALIRHRERLRRRATSTKNSMRMEMNKLGLPGPRDLETGTFHKWFTGQYEKIGLVARLAFSQLADHLAILERQILALDDELERKIEATERFRVPIMRIKDLPGFGLLTAAVTYAETGGLDRFDEAGEIVCYTGFAPRTFQSADTCRHGRISKAGPPIIRKCLINAAWTAVRSHPLVRRRFERWCKTRGKKKSIVKLAAHMLVWAWALEKKKTAFDPARLAFN
ncbi:MAG: IS110 family transposase [Chthoniobacteraceae bacterium]|nr:IS110 family transposase [Chthoniobacteraceae bacterium]